MLNFYSFILLIIKKIKILFHSIPIPPPLSGGVGGNKNKLINIIY
jgi:hypothetical protein